MKEFEHKIKYTQLSLVERSKIEAFFDLNLSIIEIARRLKRSKSTISEEVIMVNTMQSHNVLLKNVQNLTSIQNRQYLIVTASFPTEAAKKDPLKSKIRLFQKARIST